MSDRPYLSRERLLRFNQVLFGTTLPSQSPNRLTNAPPHFIMSPQNAQGTPTTGFLFALHEDPNAGAGAGPVAAAGFTITPWRLMPTIGRYASLTPITGVAFDQLVICTDLNPCALFFQIGGVTGSDGPFLMSFTEQ